MKIGITGSHNWPATNGQVVIAAVRKALRHWKANEVDIVVGCCPEGVDQIVRATFPGCVVKRADWKKYGDPAGPMRNQEIVNASDVLLAFPLPGSVGTWSCVHKADKKGIPVWICSSDGKVSRFNRDDDY